MRLAEDDKLIEAFYLEGLCPAFGVSIQIGTSVRQFTNSELIVFGGLAGCLPSMEAGLSRTLAVIYPDISA